MHAFNKISVQLSIFINTASLMKNGNTFVLEDTRVKNRQSWKFIQYTEAILVPRTNIDSRTCILTNVHSRDSENSKLIAFDFGVFSIESHCTNNSHSNSIRRTIVRIAALCFVWVWIGYSQSTGAMVHVIFDRFWFEEFRMRCKVANSSGSGYFPLKVIVRVVCIRSVFE